MLERDLGHRANIEHSNTGYTLLHLRPGQVDVYKQVAGFIPDVNVHIGELNDGYVEVTIEGNTDARSQLIRGVTCKIFTTKQRRG